MMSLPSYQSGTATHTTTPQATPSPTKAHHTGYDRITPHNHTTPPTKSQLSTNPARSQGANNDPPTIKTRTTRLGNLLRHLRRGWCRRPHLPPTNHRRRTRRHPRHRVGHPLGISPHPRLG